MASLFVCRGPDQGMRFELRGQTLSLGRDSSNRIQLHDTEVSRRHAEVQPTSSGFLLVDLKSSNGTYVDGQRVTSHELSSGEEIQLGSTWLLFTGGSDDSGDDLADRVDIIARQQPSDRSRIVRSMSQAEGKGLLDQDVADEQNPWQLRAHRNLRIMYRTALAVSHTLDIDQLLNRIMQLIFEWVEADRGCIMLLDAQTGQLEPKARRTRKGLRDDDRMTISKTILDYVMERNEGVLTSDAREDERWNPAASILQLGIREAMCVPMQGRYNMVGVIYIDTSTSPQRMVQQGVASKFTDEHLKLMIAIAHQAALAVEDTRFYSAMVQSERLAAVGQTIATLSHHIKNILQGIRGGSFLIKDGLAQQDAELVRKGWEFVEKNQERISNLVMDMLTFSKEREPELVADDLNEVVADVVELMEARAREKGVTVQFVPFAGLPELTFDPEGMHRAILNVLTNAIDACERSDDELPATSESMRVDVSAGATEVEDFGDVVLNLQASQAPTAPLPPRVDVAVDYLADAALVRVVVADNGAGIPAEEIEQIFSLFVSHKGNRGTGLGLPVSQKIIKEHGGRITVESEPGRGSRFVLEIPAVLPEAARAVTTSEVPQAHS